MFPLYFLFKSLSFVEQLVIYHMDMY